MNTIKFEYALVEKIGAPLNEVRKLIQVLDYRDKNLVQYAQLDEWLKDNSKIPEYFSKIL